MPTMSTNVPHPMHLPSPSDQAAPVLTPSALAAAARNVADLLAMAIEYTPAQAALIVYDTRCDLNLALTAAYRQAVPGATFVDFDAVTPEQVLAAFALMRAGDLVVLVQSTSFRLEAFRIRIELFKRGLKVIEHVHLSRMPGEQGLHYIASLAYDPAYLSRRRPRAQGPHRQRAI